MRLIDIPTKRKLLTRKIDGGVVVFDYKINQFFLLQGVNESVWSFIDGKKDIIQIIRNIKSEYEGSDKLVKNYVMDSLKQLTKVYLISIKN